jgi:hypothetical protein
MLLALTGFPSAQTRREIYVGDVRLKLGASQSSAIRDLSKKYEVGLAGIWKHGAELFLVREKDLEIGAVSFRNRRLVGTRNILFSQTDSGDFPEALYKAVKSFTARAGTPCKIETASFSESWHGVMFRCPASRLAVGISTDQDGKKTAGISEIIGDAE